MRVLVVDDEARMADAIATALARSGHHCRAAHSAAEALMLFEAEPADIVVTDLRMPGESGLELLRKLPKIPVIIVTAHGDVRGAVDAMKEGAFHYLTKPFDNDELRLLVQRAAELGQLTRQNAFLRQAVKSAFSPESVVAESAQSRALFDMVQRVAPTKASVLVQGPTGAGKEIVAKLLHYWSDRVGEPLVAVNCNAFAATVLDSELFGHEKGAFTGANAARVGHIERADKGTLFLDEIGEVGPDFQAKLLRVLQEGELFRVGGTEARRVDVRIIAASNRDLKAEVAAGRFREDLYFRLAVIPLTVAPLRDRREDILPLANRFLAPGRSFNAEAEQALLAHPWPGNVRELHNVVERAAILARESTVTAADLLLGAAPATGTSLDAAIDQAVRQAIGAALSGRKRQEAADLLGIDRTTLFRWMKRLGMDTVDR